MIGSNIRFIVIGGVVFGALLLASCRLFSSSGKASASGGRIEGTVVDEQRRPLAEVVVVITATTARDSYPEIAPITNEKGVFSFSELPAGQYTLRAAREGFREQTKTVTVEDGKVARVEFVLRK